MAFLAITDADAIHNYVFAPRELRLIRGGSSLLDVCNGEAAALVKKSRSERKIFDGGGQVLAAFPVELQAQEFCRRVRDLYREKTQIATVSTAIVEYPSPDQFQATLNDLLFRIGTREAASSGRAFQWREPILCQLPA